MVYYSSRYIEIVLLATLAFYIIADCAGAEGLIFGPAWAFFALYALGSRLARPLSLTIILGAGTFITDIAFLGANPRPGAAVTFAVFGMLAKSLATVQLYYFLRA